MSQMDAPIRVVERDRTHAVPLASRERENRPAITQQTIRIFDADQLREAIGDGTIEHRLLESGVFTASILRIDSFLQSLELVRYSLAVTLDGAWPKRRIGILFGVAVPQGSIVNGRPFKTGQIMLLDGRAAIRARLGAGTHLAMLSVDGDALESLTSSAGKPLGEVPSGLPLEPRDPEGRRLSSLLRAAIDAPALTADLCCMPTCASKFERDVQRAFVNALTTAKGPYRDGSNSLERRDKLVRKAEQYVVEHLDESVRMQKLCRQVGASARSLEYAFETIYGTGTMRYLRTVRMNEVRKSLIDGQKTVTVAAMDWGFWHLGEFAAAYRQLFGELPSDTLRASIGRKRPNIGYESAWRSGQEPAKRIEEVQAPPSRMWTKLALESKSPATRGAVLRK